MVEKAKEFETVLADENRELMKKYNVRGYPTILFVDPETEEVVAKLGQRDPESVVAQMDAALEKAGEKKE